MRLYRPHIPILVQLEVAERQLGGPPGTGVIAGMLYGDLDIEKDFSAKKWLAVFLGCVASDFGCTVKDLRLDHDPPLGARKRRGEGKKTVYTPAANDPDHLFYRPHGPQFTGSHDVKTRIRGDHGQYSDLTLIKRERKRLAQPKPKKTWKRQPKRKWPSRPFPKRIKQ